LAVSVADKGVGGAEVEKFKVEELKNALGDTRVFLCRVRKGLKNREMRFALVQKTAKRYRTRMCRQ
jgi:hypothetical protein